MIERQTNIRLAIVVAMAKDNVIGREGGLPWHLPGDLKWFKQVTLGKPVIMGRKTFESIGKALPGRANIVISGNRDFSPEGVVVVPSFEAAVAEAEAGARLAGEAEVMVIGGGAVYREAIGRADRLYITHVDATPEGDTHFPEIDPAVWEEVESEDVPAGEKDSHPTRFVVYERREG